MKTKLIAAMFALGVAVAGAAPAHALVCSNASEVGLVNCAVVCTPFAATGGWPWGGASYGLCL